MVPASILVPTTDAGVAAQAAVVVVLTLAGLWISRRNKDGILFVVGLFVMATALFGLRALH